jgi:hypothetical protein
VTNNAGDDQTRRATPPSGIDTLDEQILSELQHNGRLTMKALAERVVYQVLP